MGNANNIVAKLNKATGPNDELDLEVFETLFPNVDPYSYNSDPRYPNYTGNMRATLDLIQRHDAAATVSLSIRLNATTAVVTVNQRPGSTVHPYPEIALLIAAVIALSARV